MKRRRGQQSQAKLRIALIVIVAAVVVAGAAFSAGLFPFSQGQTSPGAGSISSVPQSSLHWPQNSTTIIYSLCGQGSALFWVKQDNFTGILQDINQRLLTLCSVTQTAGGIVSRQQGLYLYQITVQEKGNTTNTHTVTKKR